MNTEANIKDYISSIKNLTQYPTKFINNNNVMKLEENDKNITIGFTTDCKPKVKKLLESYHKDLTIKYISISSRELRSYQSKNSVFNSVELDVNILENDLTRLANDAPIINLVNSIIIDGITMEASDIHIEGYQNKVHLRYRIDGVLIDSDNIKKQLFSSISSRIKIMCNLNIMERRLPQDGRIGVNIEGKEIDLRVSIVPLSNGESIVLRLFIKKERVVTLEKLGYSGHNLKILNSSINNPHGLILITGPTGSGKTTTLNALLQQIKSSDKKIITIEDPVEYTIEGVNQIQVNNEIKLGFSDILRRVLRQDPDIIMIGEIRDKETAELVIRAALTGHLVLSTLHTNDAPSAISRLKDLGIPDYLITSVLKVSFAQRLIRTICKNCSGTGCKLCLNRGFKGRIAISEGFIMNDKLESIILNKAKPYEIRNYLKANGMLPLYEAGKQMVSNKITTIEEVKRVLTH